VPSHFASKFTSPSHFWKEVLKYQKEIEYSEGFNLYSLLRIIEYRGQPKDAMIGVV